MSEYLKKQILSSREVFTAKRWEGKPLSFKLKYVWANYPEVTVASAFFLIVCPMILSVQYFTFPNSKRDVIKKYKRNYTVVRDDHPEIEKIIEEKENGRHFFPK